MIRYTAANPNLGRTVAPIPAPKPSPALHGTAADRLLTWLKFCAAEEEVCPSNAQIVERLNLGCTKSAIVLFRKLEARGAIKVVRFSTSRIVELADGGRTANPF